MYFFLSSNIEFIVAVSEATLADFSHFVQTHAKSTNAQHNVQKAQLHANAGVNVIYLKREGMRPAHTVRLRASPYSEDEKKNLKKSIFSLDKKNDCG